MAETRGFDPAVVEDVRNAAKLIARIDEAVGRSIIGQQHLRKRLITALLTGGHILLEGVPGLAKTLSIKALAGAVEGTFSRVQFTPDLLPADITGSEVYRAADGKFEVRRGPVFANFVLADEINRAPAKVQAALLETMQEKQVTIGDQTLRVPEPFLVLATQNPVEQEGTYPLPEAQIDRFMIKVRIDYPTVEEEKKILDLIGGKKSAPNPETLPPVATLAEIERAKQTAASIYVDDRIKQYIVNIVAATRRPEQFKLKLSQFIELGASPRAAISLFMTSRTEALFSGEHFVVPQNIKDVAYDVLRHRMILSYEAEAQGVGADEIIKMILDAVPVP